MKVILCAADIPLDSTVTKIRGENPYRLKDKIRIFNNRVSSDPQVIWAQDGCRFLVAVSGDANVVAPDHELVWHVSQEELKEFLENGYDEQEQQDES